MVSRLLRSKSGDKQAYISTIIKSPKRDTVESRDNQKCQYMMEPRFHKYDYAHEFQLALSMSVYLTDDLW